MTVILCYHRLIRDEQVDENLYRRSYEGAPMLYHRKKSYFNEDMAGIEKNIVLDDVPANGIAITFDDGSYSNYDIGFSVLRRYALRASFFVSTALIGKEGYMTWEQLKEMADYGCFIESHSHNHRPLDNLTSEEVEYELNTSADLIEKHIGRRPHFLSLPGGREIDPKIAEKCGYKGIRSSERGFNDPFNIWKMEVVMMLNNSELEIA